MINIIALYSETGVGYHRVVNPMKKLMSMYPDEFNVYFIDTAKTIQCDIEYIYNNSWDIIFFNTLLNLKDDNPILNLLERCVEGGAKIVMDIDDHFNYGKSVVTSKDIKQKQAQHIPEALLIADYVTTTTDVYKDLLLEYNKNVFVFPNFADKDDKQYNHPKTVLLNDNGESIIRIGCTPSAMHSQDMKALIGLPYALKKSEFKDRFQMVLCGYANNFVYRGYEKILTDDYRTVSRQYRHILEDYTVNDVSHGLEPYRRVGWRHTSEYIEVYKDIDILLAPLENTSFNAVKSQIKYVEAGYTETLFVGSDVPAYNRHVKHGENGFLCRKRDDFKDTILDILKKWDATEGHKLIKSNAKEDILSNYEASIVTENRYKFFKNIKNGN